MLRIDEMQIHLPNFVHLFFYLVSCGTLYRGFYFDEESQRLDRAYNGPGVESDGWQCSCIDTH